MVRKTGFGKAAAVFVAVCMLAGMLVLPATAYAEENTTEFAGGEGTAGNPYKVATAEHLNNVHNYLSAHFEQTAPIDLSGYPNWTPIGDNVDQFTGRYNGNGYIISNLIINDDTLGDVGLFGYLGSEGVLRSIAVQNGSVRSTKKWVSVGGLVGDIEGRMIDCAYSGSVNGVESSVGGLIGVAYSNAEVTGSFSSGFVNSSGDNDSLVGGIIGFNSFGTVRNCYSTASVSCDGGDLSSIGGLVGQSDGGSVVNCYSTGTANGGAGATVGGLIGDNFGASVTNSYYLDTAASTSAGGEPLSDAQMKQWDSFEGWDFDAVWYLSENIAFPALRWQLLDVIYHANYIGGEAPVHTQRIAGETFTAAANSFTPPSGKQFKRWNTEADGTGTVYATGAAVTMPAEPLNLYAIWENRPGGGGSGTPTYRQRTLTNSSTGVTVSGNSIHSGAQLTIKTIDARSLPAQIREAIADGELIAGYDITLSGGFMGELTLSFPVGEEYNGRLITILHYVNGRVETYTAVVVDGKATVTVSSLSPFAVLNTGMIVPDTIVTDPPKTGGAAMPLGFGMLSLAALCTLCLAVKRRKYKRLAAIKALSEK